MQENEHAFAQYIRILGKGRTGSRSLNLHEAEQAMSMILQGNARPEQIGAFLMLLRVKEESAEEIAGFVLACRKAIGYQRPESLSVDLDWSSYAGKRRQPNWYILAMLLLASQGYKIFAHGACGHTPGRIYTEEVFKALNLPIARNWQEAETAITEHKLCFMALQSFCEPLDQLIQLRALFGLRSPVHTLCRLLNPLAAAATLQSVFHPSYANTHHHAAQLLDEPNTMVIKGDSGEFEFRPQANLTIKQLSKGQSSTFTLARSSAIKPTIDLDIKHLKALWQGEFDASNTAEYKFAEQAVIGTAALALLTMNEASDFDEAKIIAEQYWQQRNQNLLANYGAT